jgi:hypothetical protein
MILGDLLGALRRKLDDEVEPYLWPDEELVEYLNDSVEKLCQETLCMVDSTTEDLCRIGVREGVKSYALDARILGIKRAALEGGFGVLTGVTMEYLDACYGSNWEDMEGSPVHYVTDSDSGRLRLFPVPANDDTLRLTVYRLPLSELSASKTDEAPEVGRRYHRRLIDGVLARAYEKTDAETYDPDRAEKHLELWLKCIEDVRMERVRAEYDPLSGGAFFRGVV